MGALSVILTILKVIGIILLVLLAIILLLMAIILLVPFVYKIHIKKHEEITGDVFVSWLFGLIKVSVTIEDKEPVIKVMIFGKDLDEVLKKKKKKKRKKKGGSRKKSKVIKKKNEPPKPPKDETKPEVKETSKNSEPETVKIKKEEIPKELPKPEEIKSVSPMYKRVKMKKTYAHGDKVDSSKASITNEEETVSEELKDKAEDTKETVKEKVKLDKDYFIEMPFEEKKAVIRAVFTLIKRVFKGILPENLYIDLIVGTGNPQTTGYILAGAGVFKGLVNKHVNVKGKFDEAFLEGEVRVEGRIRLMTFVSALVRFLLQKPIRRIIIIYWKGRGE